MAQDMNNPAATGDDTQQSPQGYCIEIHVGADGKISVDVEPEADEAAEEQGEGGESSKGQPVSGFKEALQVAMDIYKNDGQIQDAGAGDSDFAEGFASGPTPVSGPGKKFA